MRYLMLCLLVCLCLAPLVAAQDTQEYEAARAKVKTLVEQNNLKDALPMLEKMYAIKSDDAEMLPYLALALASRAVTNPDETAKKKDFLRARALAEKALKLGNDSGLVKTLLDRVPTEEMLNAEPHKRTPAEEALQAGENAFSSGAMEKALAEYGRAEKLDPKLYEAPLFIGDVYFQMKKIDEAGKAYARAIAIDPDRDTAYRFWGNVLLRNGKPDEAREKFIEAVIALPYDKSPWEFLSRWAKAKGVELSHPRVEIPTSSVKRKDDKNISITAMMSDKQDGSAAWTAYSISKAAWMVDDKRFKEAYPQEAKQRHSLKEEVGCLRVAISSLEVQLKEKTIQEKDLDVSLANLLKLHRAGLLEPFLLFAKADEGIVQDYAAYRQANRAKLRQYLMEFVAPNK
jgi:Flp pilus assembly protein TadD